MPRDEEELYDIVAVMYERLRWLETIVNSHIGLDAQPGMPHPSQRIQALEIGPGIVLSPAMGAPVNGQVVLASQDAVGGVVWGWPIVGSLSALQVNRYTSDISGAYLSLTGLTSGGTGTVSLSAGVCYFVPFSISTQVTLTRAGFRVTTAGSGTAEFAIYDSSGPNGRPSARLVYGSGIDVSSAGLKLVTFSMTLVPGIYWAALRSTVNITVAAPTAWVPVAVNVNGVQYGMLTNTDTSLTNPVTTSPTTLSVLAPVLVFGDI